MMGRQTGDQSQLFYLFNLEQRIPTVHLLRRINPIVTQVLADLREKLAPFYSDIGRPSIDPELMIWMLIVGYCYGIRFERRLCEEVELHLAYRWFCRLDLDERVPDHSTFSVNRHHESAEAFAVLDPGAASGKLQRPGLSDSAGVSEQGKSTRWVARKPEPSRASPNVTARKLEDRVNKAPGPAMGSHLVERSGSTEAITQSGYSCSYT